MSAKNFGQMKSSLSSWARESVDDDIATDSLNDGIEAIWSRVLQSQVSQFVGGPVTIAVAAASERTQLISIADPTVAPTVGSSVEGALAQHTPFVAYTLMTESGSETLMSPVTSNSVIPVNQVAVVTSPARVASSLGWNVYAGSSLAAMCRQNPAPLQFGFSFTEPILGFLDAGDDGGTVGGGGPLPPTENSTADDIFYIQNLEVPLSSGGFKKWDNVSIDSMMFQWATRSLASDSEYQPYYWDLVNGRQLEYRPALGSSFNPRYFFIHKPRRISFDAAPIPFTSFPWEESLRSFALAAWFGTQREWDAEDRWRARGEARLQDSCLLLRQQDWDKNQTITPYMAGG